MSGPPDQLELKLAGAAPGARTAQIIQFPAGPWAQLSPVAASLLRDMQRRAIGADGLACHSIKDGMTCSGGARHKVVQARRELQDKGFVTLIRAGSEEGPAIWRISRTRQIAF